MALFGTSYTSAASQLVFNRHNIAVSSQPSILNALTRGFGVKASLLTKEQFRVRLTVRVIATLTARLTAALTITLFAGLLHLSCISVGFQPTQHSRSVILFSTCGLSHLTLSRLCAQIKEQFKVRLTVTATVTLTVTLTLFAAN